FDVRYHAYSRYGSVYVGREAVLEKIVWTDEGWPTFENNASYSRERAAWDFTDNFDAELNPLWQWRVTQDIDYRTGVEGLMLQSSTENEQLGTLLVQPTRSPGYDLTATVDLSKTGPKVQGGIALIGGADNSFVAPVAGIGISTNQEGVQVWRTVNQETEILGQVPTSDQQRLPLPMKVS